MSLVRDHYAVLGISADAASTVIREAYRSAMRKYHPDLNATEDAAARAKDVNEAYRVLRDPKSRAQYDSYRRRIGRPYGLRSPPDKCFEPLLTPRQEIQILTCAEQAARVPWLPFVMFVLVASGLLLGIVLSGKLDPSPIGTPGKTILEDGGGADKRIDELIASIVDDRGDSVPNVPPGQTDEPGAVAERTELLTLILPPVRGSDITYGAGKFAEVSLRSGMIGARDYSQRCHKVLTVQPSWQRADRCAAFDSTAFLVDEDLTRLTHHPADPYFHRRMRLAVDAYGLLGASPYETQVRQSQILEAVLPMLRDKKGNEAADRG